MKRYIFDIQYNETDSKDLFDRVWVDAVSRNAAEKKLRKLYPGIYGLYFITIEKEL